MKKTYTILALLLFTFGLTGCGASDQEHITQTISPDKISQINEKSLNDLMLVFADEVETYLANGKKDLNALEKMHLAFVPILGWEEFKGDEDYKRAALAVGLIVHELEDLEEDEYHQLLRTLKPAYLKFHSEYGE